MPALAFPSLRIQSGWNPTQLSPEICAKSKFALTTSVASLEELEDGEKQVGLAVYQRKMWL
jgi:hypothetical protein